MILMKILTERGHSFTTVRDIKEKLDNLLLFGFFHHHSRAWSSVTSRRSLRQGEDLRTSRWQHHHTWQRALPRQPWHLPPWRSWLSVVILSPPQPNVRSPVTSRSSDKDKTYELPNGNIITFGSDRFRCPVVLFQANFFGKEASGCCCLGCCLLLLLLLSAWCFLRKPEGGGDAWRDPKRLKQKKMTPIP